MTMSRSKLEALVGDLIKKSFTSVDLVLKDAGITKDKVNEIVMVGGMTRMPKIVADVEAYFGKTPNQSVNPDEVVALGAAIQGGIIGGDVKDILLLDVIPLSLGIETMGGVATKLIERNTTIPASRSQVFSTAADNQTSVEIHVVQGERPLASDNRTLGRFILDGIPPAPRGVPQVEVTFDIDANGILNVKAKDKSSGKEQSIKIEGSSGLSKEEIEKMKKDAEAHAADDQKKKDLAEARNLAEQLIYTSEKSLKDAEGKITDEIKKVVEEKVTELKKLKEGDDLSAIKNATENLSKEIQKIGEYMQKNTGSNPGPEPESQEQSGEPKKE
jgi:molecular chaperone DnaK